MAKNTEGTPLCVPITPQDIMSQIQFLNKYALYNHDIKRRETWRETVDRVVDYFREVVGDKIPGKTYRELYDAIFNHEVSPSMRLMATAGRGARKNQISIYNCSYLPLCDTEDFHDLAMLLGHGVGVGFSVENEHVAKWPVVAPFFQGTYTVIVPDNIEGWAMSFKVQLDNYFNGYKTIFDYSKIRPAGAPLLTRGGHASGPESLRVAHENIEELLNDRAGLPLRSVDMLDIACFIAQCIVSGGVRRSAMIAIFDKDDELMLNAKSGDWWQKNLQRSLVNISQVIDNKMSEAEWLDYVMLMDKNKSGEPGIWSRYAIEHVLPERRKHVEGFGPNPCVEQILRPYQFCNLSQIIARSDDTLETLDRKVRLAALIGTIQSAMSDFHDIKGDFRKNCEDERLLGVSISGIMDCPLINTGDKKVLNHLRSVVISENRKWAKRFGINPSTSTTCVKPDGNTSVLYDTSPGVHGRYAPYYIRRLQVQANTPVANFAIESGIPCEPILGESWEKMNTLVLSFPVKSPVGAVIQRERSAVEQLDNWLAFKKEYTETNPSVTIIYRPEELSEMARWLYVNQEHTVGLSFLPADDHTYQQTPYEEISEAEYNRLCSEFPDVDMDSFWQWEVGEDTTDAAKNMACVGGVCLI